MKLGGFDLRLPKLPKWLLAVLFFVSVLVAFSADWLVGEPWELGRWKNMTSQPQFQNMLMEDWYEMSGEAKFWFIRGYMLASLTWYGHSMEMRPDDLQEYMASIWPINEKQLSEMMATYALQKEWRKLKMGPAFIDLFIKLRKAGMAPWQY